MAAAMFEVGVGVICEGMIVLLSNILRKPLGNKDIDKMNLIRSNKSYPLTEGAGFQRPVNRVNGF
ncbi:MAG: hypothetical protein VW169_11565 [Rhodospirillaceae bacterium]